MGIRFPNPGEGVDAERELNVRERLHLNLLWRVCQRRMGANPPEDPDEIYVSVAQMEKFSRQIDDAIAAGLPPPTLVDPLGATLTHTGPTSSAGGAVKKYKVCEFLDQRDNIEIQGPLDQTMVEGFRATYRKHMKGDPHPGRYPIDEHWWIFGLRIQAG